MYFENYCSKCGHRIHPNEPYCEGCGLKTHYEGNGDDNIISIPIHSIGFFNFDIDFSPYLTFDHNFNFDICSCGYINDINNDYCSMCGNKRNKGIFSRILKNKNKIDLTDNILCECGALNSQENTFCEMCGRNLQQDQSFDNYSNFNLEFNDSVFCFCGEENDKSSQFCRNCGFPLKNYGNLKNISYLCCCSTVNNITSDYCVSCGESFKKENSKIICVCGHKNANNLKFCEECERPLNPKKIIKSRIICSCGEILDWDSEYCPNCGKNIKKRIMYKNSINNAVGNLKKMFR